MTMSPWANLVQVLWPESEAEQPAELWFKLQGWPRGEAPKCQGQVHLALRAAVAPSFLRRDERARAPPAVEPLVVDREQKRP